jgi:hypothetical protein
MEFILYTFLYALFLYGIGYLALKLCKIKIDDPYTRVFVSNITGMILWVWVLSCIRTQGLTVMNAVWIPLLSIIFYAYKNKLLNKNNSKLNFNIHNTHLLWGGAIVGLSVMNYLFNLGYSINNPASNNVDTIYYVRLSEFIYHTGTESTNIDYLQIKANYPNPYHYFTPWLQAGFNAIFNIENNYLVRNVVIFTIYFSNFYIGLIAILKKLVKNNTLCWYHFILPILFFFIKPIGLGSFTAKIYGNYALYWVNSLIQLPKHSPIIMMLLLFVLLIQNRQYTTGILTLLLLPVFYITTAPAIYGIISCIILWVWLKKIKNISVVHIIICALLVAVYLTLFYGFYPKQNYIVNPTGNQINFWERFYHFSFLNVFFKDIFQVSFAFIISVSLLAGLSILFYRTIKKRIIAEDHLRFLSYFIIAGFAVSIFIWQMLYYIADSEQFFASLSTPLYIILVFLWIGLLLELCIEQRRKIIIVLLSGYISALIYSAIHASLAEIKNYRVEYSPEYITFIKKNKDRFSEYGAMFIDNKYIWYLYFHGFPKPYIQNKNPRDFFAINICELQPAKESYELDKLYIPLFSFYQYVEKQKKENTFTNLSQSKLDFIKKYRVNHIVANKTAKLDSIFLPYITEKYIDKYSGEQLYFLDIPQK